MSTMAVSSRGLRSTLNPNAPVFIPAALRQVEEFSPEWYELVKTSPSFREHWYSQQQQEGIYGEDDAVNMLPDSFDLGVNDELSHLEELDEAIFQQAFVSSEDSIPYVSKDGKFKTGTESLLKNLNLKSPNNYDMKSLTEAAKYREKPVQAISPKPSSRRIIQQPR